MALLLNEANNDLSAESHLDFLATMLPATSEYIWYNPFAATALADARERLEEQQDSFVECLRKRRRLYEERVEYEQLKSIPPTSNVVERFFSVARVTFGHQRHGLLPRTLETLLFLRENRSYWDSSTVDSLQ
ncbi:hypothetical protein GQ600_23816 [Phytophthora cactorum]|nr:hypothetical protein GQ600_23816 [Phytophthora cactorum]